MLSGIGDQVKAVLPEEMTAVMGQASGSGKDECRAEPFSLAAPAAASAAAGVAALGKSSAGASTSDATKPSSAFNKKTEDAKTAAMEAAEKKISEEFGKLLPAAAQDPNLSAKAEKSSAFQKFKGAAGDAIGRSLDGASDAKEFATKLHGETVAMLGKRAVAVVGGATAVASVVPTGAEIAFHYAYTPMRRTETPMGDGTAELAELQRDPDSYIRKNYQLGEPVDDENGKTINVVPTSIQVFDTPKAVAHLTDGHLYQLTSEQNQYTYYRRVPLDLYNKLREQHPLDKDGRLVVTEKTSIQSLDANINNRTAEVLVEIKPPYRDEDALMTHQRLVERRGADSEKSVRNIYTFGPPEGLHADVITEVTLGGDFAYARDTESNIKVGFPMLMDDQHTWQKKNRKTGQDETALHPFSQKPTLTARQQTTLVNNAFRFTIMPLKYGEDITDLTDKAAWMNDNNIKIAMTAYADTGSRFRLDAAVDLTPKDYNNLPKNTGAWINDSKIGGSAYGTSRFFAETGVSANVQYTDENGFQNASGCPGGAQRIFFTAYAEGGGYLGLTPRVSKTQGTPGVSFNPAFMAGYVDISAQVTSYGMMPDITGWAAKETFGWRDTLYKTVGAVEPSDTPDKTAFPTNGNVDNGSSVADDWRPVGYQRDPTIMPSSFIGFYDEASPPAVSAAPIPAVPSVPAPVMPAPVLTQPPEAPSSPPPERSVTAQSGDSAWQYWRDYADEGVSWNEFQQQFAQKNALPLPKIPLAENQELVLPNVPTGDLPRTVRRGDTVWEYWKSYEPNAAWGDFLKEFNALNGAPSSSGQLSVGQKVIIPDMEPA